MMKFFLHLFITLCFTTHVSAVDFTTLEETRGLVQTNTDGQGTLDLQIPAGTSGKVSKMIRYLAKNNRNGEYGYAIALKVDHVGTGQTSLRSGETIILYYSSEESERILKLTDAKHHEIKDATQAKWGITTVDTRIKQPLPKTIEKIAKVEGCASPLGQQNGQAIKDSIQCIINHQRSAAKDAESKSVPATVPAQAVVPYAKPASAPQLEMKVNSAAEGEVLSYMNNVVWDDIQKDGHFNSKHFHLLQQRDAARLAEFEKRKKINAQVAPLITKYANLNGLNLSDTVSLIRTESMLNPKTCSPKGACGLYQIMIKTAREYSGNPNLTKKQLHDIETNILVGTKVSAVYLQKEHGDIDNFLIAYNCGLTCQARIARREIEEPIETINYVKRFHANKAEFDRLTKKVHDYVIVQNSKLHAGNQPAS